MSYNPFLEDQIRDIVSNYVEPEKRGLAMVAIKKLKSDTIKSVMNKVNNYVVSLNTDVETKLL